MWNVALSGGNRECSTRMDQLVNSIHVYTYRKWAANNRKHAFQCANLSKYFPHVKILQVYERNRSRWIRPSILSIAKKLFTVCFAQKKKKISSKKKCLRWIIYIVYKFLLSKTIFISLIQKSTLMRKIILYSTCRNGGDHFTYFNYSSYYNSNSF